MDENKNTDFKPRSYQCELMEIALKKNTIIFLPTGSGKTYIALMVLKRMSGSLLKPYGEGGKISIILVNTVALVEQHAKYIREHTPLTVGQYTGEMNLDFWPRDKWYKEYDKYQVIIMTCQILVNLNHQKYIDLNKVNLLVFDECHRGVNDHSMRTLMKSFGNLHDPPRVLGLTATLLNRNCKPDKVMDEVLSLETTYHSKIATVDGLADVVGFSTNPTEDFKVCQPHRCTHMEVFTIQLLEKSIDLLASIHADAQTVSTLQIHGLKPLETISSYRKLSRLLLDIIEHIHMLGSYGAVKTLIAHSIQMERMKKHCGDLNVSTVLTSLLTTLQFGKELITKVLSGHDERQKIFRHSSDKLLKLLEIFQEYKSRSREELCCIVFVQRRFTAKIIFHILKALSDCDPEFSYIKPDFIVGYNCDPMVDTREALYFSKKNKQILESFINKEINVLVASDVLEEGVDIPKCTLVIKFDKPNNYRSYIQSKGRARHKESLYYIIFESTETDFMDKYREYQVVEQKLNDYLVGKNEMRLEPSLEKIEEMYYEDELPPYYVDGPGSAQVNMLSAIPLLCQYCNSLPSDVYTIYAPEWYEQTKKNSLQQVLISVVIMLPVICPVVDIIEGKYMLNRKLAKRAAALQACILLHKAGELDDHLLPIRRVVNIEDVQYLFRHYPATPEPDAGTNKKRRLYKKKMPKCLKGELLPKKTYYLHIIHLEPKFSRHDADINQSTIYDSYISTQCFGLITCNVLPVICDFPLYLKGGQIYVTIEVNQDKVEFDENDIANIKKFQGLIFMDVLRILQPFLVFDNSSDAEILLVVPVNKSSASIDFDLLRSNVKFNPIKEITLEEKLRLDVTQESHLRKIVSPWYRPDSCYYIVTEVCLNKSADYQFPNDDFSSFKHYFNEKHNLHISKPDLPILLVKGITKQLNFIQPKFTQKENKRKRSDLYEEMDEYLIPELLVKQDLPSPLWIQASFLPSILDRVIYCLQLEEFRCKIVRETGLGKIVVDKQSPLILSLELSNYQPSEFDDEEKMEKYTGNITIIPNASCLSPTSLHFNKDFTTKKLESQYPWKDVEEPKDIERELNVTVMDIDYYEIFLNRKVDEVGFTLANESPTKLKRLALTYHKDFIPINITLLESPPITCGPELCDIYQAMTAIKANDIVNLERLETLGDSFLKFISTVYIFLRFPNYDEGRATSLKSRLVSNKNLYYLANRKNIGAIMKYHRLSPKEEWLPPPFTIPKLMEHRIEQKEISLNALFNLHIPSQERVTGIISEETISKIQKEDYPVDETEDDPYISMAPFLKSQYISDKNVADAVESLLGLYFRTCGISGAIRFVEWMGIIPKSENLEKLLKNPSPSAVINQNAKLRNIDVHIPQWHKIEKTLDYSFKDRGYLLQALSHSSYTPNRITHSYEKLEFVGDAILDFLITCHIFESCGNLDPGQLTDLRAALVNNVTFASLAVRCDFHKYLLIINSKLQGHIDNFVKILEQKNYEIDDHILTLLEEGELTLVEQVDVPKVLGDLFESIIGAVYLDSGKNLKEVWRVIYKIMWKEIGMFSHNVPKNVIRKLFEWNGAYPKFGNTAVAENGKTIIPLQFMKNGIPQIVYGCGSNKSMARKAAAKLALQNLEEATT